MTSYPAINFETVRNDMPRLKVDEYGYKWTKLHCQYKNGQKSILFLIEDSGVRGDYAFGA